MQPLTKRGPFALLALSMAYGCGGSIDGPSPTVSAVAPPAVCQEQITTTVALTGTGLSPLYTGALDNGKLELPKITLTRVVDAAGVSLGTPTTIAIPDDASVPAASRVRWTSQSSMSFDVFPELLLGSGLYDITVANADGKKGQFPSSLLVVPPPTLAQIEADLACSEKPNSFTLTGDFFVRSASAQPTVNIGGQILVPSSMTGCRELPGTGGFQACTQMKVELAQSVLAPSVVPVVVTNPDPVGCHSSEPVMLTLVPAPVVTSVIPDLACAAEGAVLVTVQGTGFLTVDGRTPSVTIAGATVTSTASECTSIAGLREQTQTCTQLQIAIPMGTAAGRPDVVVLNPAPADCSSAPTYPITLFDRPVVLAAIPDMACAAEDAVAIKIQGSGFLTVDGVLPTVTVDNVQVTATVTADSCTPVPYVIETVQLCTELVITVPKSTAAGQPVVVVQNPVPANCSSLASKPFMLFDRPAVATAIPDMVCAAEGVVPVTLTGTGFLTVDGVVPAVTVGSLALTPVPSECTAVVGPKEVVQTCTKLQITIPAATAAGRPTVVVKNPAPAGCSSLPSTPVTLFDRPVLASAVPDLACTADGSVSVKLTGTGFLTIDGVAPTVSVAGGAALTSTASGCAPIVGPSELAQLCTELTVLVPGGTVAGRPDFIVTNPPPVGCSSLPIKPLNLVDRPTITSVTPDETCSADGAQTVVIKGTGFLTVDGVAPVVKLGTLSLPTTAVDCSKLEGPAEVVSVCTEVDVVVPADAPAGALALSVTNPAPAGCASLAGPVLTLFDRPTISKVTPGSACENAASTSVVLTGSNFIVLDGATPSVRIGAQTYTATASGCTAVPNTVKPTQTCTGLTVTIAPSSLTPGKLSVVVTNPAGVGCASTGTAVLEITAPPQLTAVSPATVCAGAASITLTGTNFASAATVTVNGIPARSVTVSANGQSAVADMSGLLSAGGPYDVTISNGTGCSSTKSAAVTVVNGPQIFFYDPSVAYNGISIRGTLYGSGFTGAVQSVTIKTGSAAALPLSFKQDAANPNHVLAVTPKGTPPGTYDIELHDTTACPATLPGGLVVTATTTVTLTTPALTPPFGWKDGSTAGTVTATAAATGFVAVPRLYLNPVSAAEDTVATPLGAVAFIDKTQLTVMVPAGLSLGAYDLIVVNPDGTVGVAEAAYEVMAAPPPQVDAISPGSVQNQAGQVVNISGSNFRTPSVKLFCVDSAGVALANSPAAPVSNATATGLTITFDGSAAGAACVIRVINKDNDKDSSYADFSAVVVTNPAQNLYPAKSGPTLASARRAPVALGGDASSAARYLHVIGGDDGNATTFDTVETAPLNLLGVPSAFFTQRNKLKHARAFAAGVQIGRYLYVVGGEAAGTAIGSVERAYVLDPAKRDQITDLAIDIDKTAGVGPGIWYYRVAAVMAATDALNPGGENLPSDPFPVRLPDLGTTKFDVSLTWQAQTGAVKYRVYRSPVAGATAGTEQVIAEIAAPGSTFTDTGIAPIATDVPLPIGSLGTWQVLPATLVTARAGAGAAWGMDPADASKAYLYVLGGRQNATTALASIEILPMTLEAGGVQTPGAAFTASTTPLSAARWQLGASHATNNLSPRIPANTTYVYALSGVAADGAIVSKTEAAPIVAGGQLGAFTDLGNSLNRAGYATMVAGNFVFAFGGGNAGPDTGVISGEICGPGVNGCGPAAKQVPPGIANWNAGQSMQVTRYLMGGTLSGAYFYVVGGVTSAGSPPTLTNSTEYRLW